MDAKKAEKFIDQILAEFEIVLLTREILKQARSSEIQSSLNFPVSTQLFSSIVHQSTASPFRTYS